jgi:hypothetical protein
MNVTAVSIRRWAGQAAEQVRVELESTVRVV